LSNEIVPFDADFLGLIHGSFGQDGLPLPFVREIFLLETHVAGTSFVDQIKTIDKDLGPREFVILKREPGNRYDDLAILILDPQGRKLGYVPKSRNEVLARLMDAGKLIFGRVESKKWQGSSYLLVTIRIYMRDF
jgi:hypothetical protein